MVAASVVVVGDNNYVGAAEMLGKGCVPLTDAHSISCCGDAVTSQRIAILLALDDENSMVRRDGLDQLGQPVGHPSDALHAPHPAILHVIWHIAGASPAALSEGFGFVATNLKQQRAVLVGVVVGRNDPAPPVAAAIADAIGITMLAQPVPGLGNVFALEQIEHAAAFVGLEVKPGAFFEIDAAGAVA